MEANHCRQWTLKHYGGQLDLTAQLCHFERAHPVPTAASLPNIPDLAVICVEISRQIGKGFFSEFVGFRGFRKSDEGCEQEKKQMSIDDDA